MNAALSGPAGRTPLEATVLTIGSSPDNRLVVNDVKVSAHHAEIRPEGQGFSISDLGSTHGTYVNSQRLDWNTPHLLTPGSTITIGDTAFIYEERAAADAPAGSASLPNELTPGNQQLPHAGAATPAGSPAYASPQSYMQQYPAQAAPGVAGTYPAYAAPFPGYAPPAPARGSRRRWLWIGLVLLLIIGIAAGAAIVYFTRATPEKTIDAFCNSMQGQDYRSAYNLLSSSLQSTETEKEFAGGQQALGRTTICTHDNPNVTGNEATANLTLGSAGQTYTGIISLVQANNAWKISVLLSSPQLTLTTFCNALGSGDFHTAYSQFSSGLRGANPEAIFTQRFRGVTCTFGAINASGGAGAAAIVFRNPAGQFMNDIVGLIQDPAANSVWKIDGIQSAP